MVQSHTKELAEDMKLRSDVNKMIGSKTWLHQVRLAGEENPARPAFLKGGIV